MALFDRIFSQNRQDRNDSKKFSKIFDYTSVPSERILLLYRGNLAGRNENIVYQFAVIRAVLHFRVSQLPKNNPTHEFTCIYRDLQGVFRILFLFKFDCRISDRSHDKIANQIGTFLAELLIHAVDSPGSVRNLLVSQDSLDFWSEAFQKRVISLAETYEENDKNRYFFE